jgi:hypothetical protein
MRAAAEDLDLRQRKRDATLAASERHSGHPRAAAAACATASDTATVALPPSFALFGVPSSAINVASMPA